MMVDKNRDNEVGVGGVAVPPPPVLVNKVVFVMRIATKIVMKIVTVTVTVMVVVDIGYWYGYYYCVTRRTSHLDRLVKRNHVMLFVWRVGCVGIWCYCCCDSTSREWWGERWRLGWWCVGRMLVCVLVAGLVVVRVLIAMALMVDVVEVVIVMMIVCVLMLDPTNHHHNHQWLSLSYVIVVVAVAKRIVVVEGGTVYHYQW